MNTVLSIMDIPQMLLIIAYAICLVVGAGVIHFYLTELSPSVRRKDREDAGLDE